MTSNLLTLQRARRNRLQPSDAQGSTGHSHCINPTSGTKVEAGPSGGPSLGLTVMTHKSLDRNDQHGKTMTAPPRSYAMDGRSRAIDLGFSHAYCTGYSTSESVMLLVLAEEILVFMRSWSLNSMASKILCSAVSCYHHLATLQTPRLDCPETLLDHH